MSTKAIRLRLISLAAGLVLFLGACAYSSERSYSESTQTVSVADVSDIVVTVEVGDVTIRSAAGPSVELQTHQQWGDWTPHAEYRVQGSLLEVSADCGAVAGAKCQVDEQLTVPPNITVRVVLKSGRIDAIGIDVPRFDSQTGAGEINIAFSRPPLLVRAHSGAGAVNLTVPADSYRVDARSLSGEVKVDVAQDLNAPYVLDAYAQSGDVHIIRA
jgi:hypothetical protein